MIRPIAIYLPQFHPIPENDDWWGKGFTEWTNVTKAKPLFKNHYQPHLPADLGFYDLRLAEARLEQEKMAKKYGIYGFCYYHYWFNGKRLLEKPLDSKMANAAEDLPFMLCWANENWTRSWDGKSKNILLEQIYSDEDSLNHIHHLIEYFKDSRYIKVDNKPVFIIYRPKFIPNLSSTLDIWRREVKKAGFADLFIGFSKNIEHAYHPLDKGFDFAFDFQPNFNNLPQIQSIFAKLSKWFVRYLDKEKYKNHIYNYKDFKDLQLNASYDQYIFPCLTPMWDNSARKKSNYFILHNSSPELYATWLKYILENYPWNMNNQNFLFINAWNEWAEGNHLEPCQKWGTAYLEKTKEILESYTINCSTD